MHKTISELAKESQVSRQAIHQAIDKLLDKSKLNKKGNSFILDDQQQAIIRDSFTIKGEGPSSKSSSKSSNNSSSELTTTLQQQNKFLIQELENKNKQINELHILLLKEKEEPKFLELIDQEESIKDQEPKKRKWYDRFKRKKKTH